MTHEFPQPFARNYESLHKRLRLRGIPPPQPRPAVSCTCCGKPMRIVRTRVKCEVNTSRSLVPIREADM